MLKRAHGFTLIELLIVIAIVAILTVAFLPTLRGGQAGARNAARRSAVNDIVVGIERIINNDVPAEVAGGAPPASAAGDCLVFSNNRATPGGAITLTLGKAPVAQPAAGVNLCGGGFFYRTFGNNYVVAVQVEGDVATNGNVGGVAIAVGPDAAAALAGARGAFDTWPNSITRATATPSTNALYLVTK
jgi:prepilin-type N-terminal cleavage/methylation domain-containing protein